MVSQALMGVWSFFSRSYQTFANHHLCFISSSLIRIIDNNTYLSPMVTLFSKTMQFDRPSKENSLCIRNNNRGIWLLASHINSSCLHNVSLSWIGPMLIVRATCGLPANTEIKCWGHKPDHCGDEPVNFPCRVNNCTCPLCVQNEATPHEVLEKRLSLREQLGDILCIEGKLTVQIKRLLKAFENTCSVPAYSMPAIQAPNLGLCDMYVTMAVWHSVNRRPKHALFLTLRLFVSLGFVFTGFTYNGEITPPTVKLLVASLRNRNIHFEVSRWGMSIDSVLDGWYLLHSTCSHLELNIQDDIEACARISYKILMGEDETFEEKGKTFWGMMQEKHKTKAKNLGKGKKGKGKKAREKSIKPDRENTLDKEPSTPCSNPNPKDLQ